MVLCCTHLACFLGGQNLSHPRSDFDEEHRELAERERDPVKMSSAKRRCCRPGCGRRLPDEDETLQVR
jgi:hypothetical protein